MIFIKNIFVSVLAILLLATISSAYQIPAEYLDQARNEVEVYILATSHQGESWADVVLYDQMCQNVGCKAVNGRYKLNRQMEYYMQFYYTPKMPEMPLIGN